LGGTFAAGRQLVTTVMPVPLENQGTPLPQSFAESASRAAVAVDDHAASQNEVQVKALTAVDAQPEEAIRRAAAAGAFDLVILGSSLHVGGSKFLGCRSAALVRAIRTPVLLVAQ
jgi:nucleotide-binding universal stress UspA family protein